MIRRAGISQRQIEEQTGLSRGYLSLLLAQKVEAKVWHVLAVVEALGAEPGEVFARIYPVRRSGVHRAPGLGVSSPADEPPPTAELDEALDRLYSLGAESVGTLRQRLERCERALATLESSGRLPPSAAREGQEPAK